MALDGTRLHGIETYSGPEPMKRDESGIQLGIASEQITGKEVSIETLPAEASDYRIILEDLDDGLGDEVKVEKGLVNRALIELSRKTNWIAKFNQEFNLSPQTCWDRYKQDLNETEFKAKADEAMNLLKELLGILNSNQDMDQIKGQMSMLNMGGKAGLGPDASSKLAEFISTINEQREFSSEAKKKANDKIREIIESQINLSTDIAEKKLSWDSLHPSTQNFVRHWYTTLRWGEEEGTLKRNAELYVLTTHRKGAPAFVYPGRERHVYQSILKWRFYKKQLKEADLTTRTELLAKMEAAEAEVKQYTCSYTGESKHQPTFGAVGSNQVTTKAWYEIHDLVDNNREDFATTFHAFDPIADDLLLSDLMKEWAEESGGNRPESEESKLKEKFTEMSYLRNRPKPKKTFLYGSQSADKISWETRWHKNEIYVQYGAVYNAWQSLVDLGSDDFITQYAQPIKLEENDEAEKHAEVEKELEKALKVLDRKVMAAIAKASSARKNIETAVEALAAIKGAIGSGAMVVRGKGGGGQTSEYPLSQAADRLQSARQLKNDADEALAEIEAKEEEVRQKLSDHKAKSPTPATPAVDPVTLEQKKRYYNLLLKCYDYLTQDVNSTPFLKMMSKFDPEEMKILARLIDFTVQDDKDGNLRLAPKSIVTIGDGDYAFLNLDAIPELTGRLSPDILRQLFKNEKRFPEISKLLNNAKNKFIIVAGSPIEHGTNSGINEKSHYGTGRQFNKEKAEELKKIYNWNDRELFMRWLDDLTIQRELGVHPEELESRYITWMTKQHQLRKEFLPAEDDDGGWTLIHDSTPAGTDGYFESTIRRLKDAGYQLTSDNFRSSPFYAEPGKSNESTYIITDKDLTRQVLHHGEDLVQNPETNAPETLVARLFQSLRDELLLYRQKTLIAGQTYGTGNGMTADDVQKLGALVQANMDLINDKYQALENIYYDLNLNAEQRLDALQGFSRTGMKDLTYELVDHEGRINVSARNRTLWKYYNGTAQYGGKLARDLRELQWVYAQTQANPGADDNLREVTRVAYLSALGTWRNFNMKQNLLGMQAAGLFNEMDNKQVGKYIAKQHARMTFDQYAKYQENQMRAIFEYDNDFRPFIANASRRLVGLLFKNRVADFGRWIGHTLGIGDRFLRELDIQQLSSIARNKFDDQWMRRLAAHTSYSIQTNYQKNWGGLFRPASSNLLYPGSSGVASLFGEDHYVPSQELSPTGDLLFQIGEYRVADDIGDAIDRTLLLNLHPLLNAGKNAGWDVDELMHQYLRSRMNDQQHVVPGGQGLNPNINRQYNMFSNRHNRQTIDSLDEHLLTLTEERLGRGLWWFNEAPLDTRYTSYNRTNPPIGQQHRDSLNHPQFGIPAGF